jgi:hypothetical protein
LPAKSSTYDEELETTHGLDGTTNFLGMHHEKDFYGMVPAVFDMRRLLAQTFKDNV